MSLQATIDEALALVAARSVTDLGPRDTIRPELGEGGELGARVKALLERLHGEGSVGPGGAFKLERTLGEGGMGLVHLATQRALGRKVAVKTLRPEVRDPAATERLLSEAMITGALEHPNIVPVHALGLDDGGRPYIVLKRIEGEEWGALMRDERGLKERFGARDALEWNLRILMQVCEAVQFAHSRGILHRDLKPENVMVGEFGEVYVLDWGIAVALLDDGSGRFPLAADAGDIAGTPCYMAPEMLGGDPPRLSERTDVYLLGAILFEILAGRPPHVGKSLVELAAQVALSRPAIPEGAPAELARIVLRAMDPDPDARFETARQVRLAVQGFLQHRDSATVAQEAGARLAELLAALGGPAATADAPAATVEKRASDAGAASAARSASGGLPVDAAARRRRLYNLLGACRFGFRQALRAWPENRAAREGLRRAAEAMIDFELREASPEGAAAILAELADAPAELTARVEKARADRDEERRQMEDLHQQARALDPRVGRIARRWVTSVIGSLWTVAPLGAGLLDDRIYGHHAPYAGIAVWTALLLGVSGTITLLVLRPVLASALNRRVAAAMLFTLLGQLVLTAGCAILGVEPIAGTVLHFFLWFVVSALVAITLEPRMAVASAGYLVAFLIAAWKPGNRFWIMSSANLVLTLTLMYAWRPEDLGPAATDGDEPEEPRAS